MKQLLSSLWRGLTHNADGTFSSTKFWQAVGYIVSSYIMLWLTRNGKMSSEYLLIYVGAVTTARGFQNFLSARAARPATHSPRLDRNDELDRSLRPPLEL